MNEQKWILGYLRRYYKQSSIVSLRPTKKTLETLFKTGIFKYKYQPRIAYHILRVLIKDKHTKNCRFLATTILTDSEYHWSIINHYTAKHYNWSTIDDTLTGLAVSLKS